MRPAHIVARGEKTPCVIINGCEVFPVSRELHSEACDILAASRDLRARTVNLENVIRADRAREVPR